VRSAVCGDGQQGQREFSCASHAGVGDCRAVLLPALTDFLSTTVTEQARKLVQPAGLIPAALFLLLNVTLVFYTGEAQATPIIGAFVRMPGIWQALIMLGIVLVLGYLIASLSAAIMKLATGELWARSPVFGLVGGWWQNRRLQALRKRRKALLPSSAQARGPLADDAAQAALDLFTEFPVDEAHARAYLAPTSLGNVVNAVASHLWLQYRIDLTALWPHMEQVVATDAPLAARIGNERSTLEFLVNLWFVLWVFMLEYALLVGAYWQRQDKAGLVALILIPLAWIVYRAAIGKARTWGSLLQMAFDLHREDLRKALHLRAFTSVDDERSVWDHVSGWLLWPQPPDMMGDLFENQPWHAQVSAPTPVIIATRNVSVEQRSVVIVDETEALAPPNSPQTLYARTKYIEYTLLISNGVAASSSGAPGGTAKHVSLVISDPRVPVITDVAKDVLVPLASAGQRPIWGAVWRSPPPELLTAGAAATPAALLWRVGGIPATGACTLRYRVRVGTLFQAKLMDASAQQLEMVGSNVASSRPPSSRALMEGVTLRVERIETTEGAGVRAYTLILTNTKATPILTHARVEVTGLDLPTLRPFEGRVTWPLSSGAHVRLRYGAGRHIWCMEQLDLSDESLYVVCRARG
jgi:hypothetical protein